VETWLGEDRRLPGVELLRRAREAGYQGGKSALYELIRRLRAPAIAPMVRFEGVPGEFSQHDFGHVDVRYTSGAVERIHFFASRLKWSRMVDVVLVPDEREETLIRGLLAALEGFGGVPLVTVWDNPKTVVVSRTGDRIVWNPIFGQVALDYRFAPELCWPRSPSKIWWAGSKAASSRPARRGQDRGAGRWADASAGGGRRGRWPGGSLMVLAERGAPPRAGGY
jgi:transposase